MVTTFFAAKLTLTVIALDSRLGSHDILDFDRIVCDPLEVFARVLPRLLVTLPSTYVSLCSNIYSGTFLFSKMVHCLTKS